MTRVNTTDLAQGSFVEIGISVNDHSIKKQLPRLVLGQTLFLTKWHRTARLHFAKETHTKYDDDDHTFFSQMEPK